MAFVALHNYGTNVEAELHAELLRAEGIPVLMQGMQAGAMGPGFSGAWVQGMTLLVPEEELEHAQYVIGDADFDDAG